MKVSRYQLTGTTVLFGGTFDPPHLGHAAIGKLARGLLSASEWCVVMPTSQNPLKDPAVTGASSAERLEMTKLAFPEAEGFLVSDFEIGQPPPSFTIDTVRALRAENPELKKVFLILGQDSAATLSRWRAIDELLSLVEPVVVMRSGLTAVDPALSSLQQGMITKVLELAVPTSSTGIRADYQNATNVGVGGRFEEISKEIQSFILERGLYRSAPR